ncbi:hypothetical protein [Mycobacterium hubeiense]|uniref:hypothetical protein n=1 Tax=Mycobacterium hubeiense TaxID=1867256 RepID=UPI001E53295C|nr:hypothetical protein [Mycobacterium sp. QGD 101]
MEVLSVDDCVVRLVATALEAVGLDQPGVNLVSEFGYHNQVGNERNRFFPRFFVRDLDEMRYAVVAFALESGYRPQPPVTSVG